MSSTQAPPAIRAVNSPGELGSALAELGLDTPRPVLVLIGGAANLPPSVADALSSSFDVLARELDRFGAAVVDGGTAFGVMALIGESRSRTGATFPLLGVVARGTVALPGRDQGSGTPLDPNHSHILVVPGDRWGDESAWIGAAARHLGAGQPILTLVAAGGTITRLDVANQLAAHHPLLVLAGSGGTADQIADWCDNGTPVPDLAMPEQTRSLVQVLQLTEATDRLPGILAREFGA